MSKWEKATKTSQLSLQHIKYGERRMGHGGLSRIVLVLMGRGDYAENCVIEN